MASLLVAGLYVGLALWGAFPKSALGGIGPAIAFGLPLIWFPNLAAFVVRGFSRASGPEEPESMIVFAGWLILLILPFAVAWLSADARPVRVLPH